MGLVCCSADNVPAGEKTGGTDEFVNLQKACVQDEDQLDMVINGYLRSCSERYSGLSVLNVVCGGELTLNGSAVPKQLQKSDYFEPEPAISWSVSDVPKGTVIMVDLGPLGDNVKGLPFPIVHSIWTDCMNGDLTNSTVIKPYGRPGCSWLPPNRYTFILFRQGPNHQKLTFGGRPASDVAKEFSDAQAKGLGFMEAWKPFFFFDAGKFLVENAGLSPVAANFVLVGGIEPTMKIKSAEAHFHPFQVGAPRPEAAHKAIDEFCAKFAAGLANPANDALLNLFADDGTWADPVGGPPPYVGKTALRERITKLPPMDFAKVVEVFYTVNDKLFWCKTEIKFKDKPKSFMVVDIFTVDDNFKIKSAQAHFHPFQVGAPRNKETKDAHTAIVMFCDKFAAGLANPADDALLNLFADDGTWADPVGGPPPYVGRGKIAERITKLPPMDYAKVLEVYYTVNSNIFLCKTEVKFKDKPNAFTIIDKFVAA